MAPRGRRGGAAPASGDRRACSACGCCDAHALRDDCAHALRGGCERATRSDHVDRDGHAGRDGRDGRDGRRTRGGRASLDGSSSSSSSSSSRDHARTDSLHEHGGGGCTFLAT